MGCCQSSTAAVPKSNHHHPDLKNSQAAPPPPPLVIEEETVVKEVLTETPIPKPPTSTLVHTQLNKQPPQVPQLKIEPVPEAEAEVTTKKEEIFKLVPETFSEVSEVSELCSFTESYSTTTALTEKRDDDDEGEVTQRVNRSPAKVPRKRQYTGEQLRGRERGMVRSPAKRSVPSPEKKGQLPSRSVTGRNAAAPQRRNVGAANTVRRDPADGSSRRSRSPATRGEVGQRPNVRHSSPSVATAAGARRPAIGKVEKEEGTVNKTDDGGGGGGGGAVPEPRESLDNPLVSLECFIFL